MSDMTENVDVNQQIESDESENVFEDKAKTGRTITNIEKTLFYEMKKELPGKDDKEVRSVVGKLLKIHGLNRSRFDMVASAENTINENILNDDSIDPNGNKTEKTVESIMQEVMASTKKLIGYDELYRQMKNDWGKSEAKRLSGEMYSYALALADSTAIMKPYCYCLDARTLVLDGRKFGQLPSKPAKRLDSYISMLTETVHQMSNHLAGAVAVGTFFFDSARVLMKSYSLNKIKKNKKVRKYIENEYQQFVHSVNFLSRNASESPFTNISIFDRPKLKNLLEGERLIEYFPKDFKNPKEGEYLNEKFIIDYVMELQKIFIEFFDKGDTCSGGMPYRFPVLTVNMSKDDNGEILDEEFVDYMCHKDIYRYNIFVSKGTKLAMCCRFVNNVDTMKEYAASSNSFGGSAISIGSHRVITIDFMRIALLCKNKNEYFKLLGQYIDDTAKILKSHKNLLKLLTDKGMQLFIQNGWIKLDHLFSTFGVLGLVEASNYIKNNYEEYKGNKKDPIADSLKFLDKNMLDVSRKYEIIGNIEQIPAESMAVRLCKADGIIFGEDKVPYKLYANQFVPLWQNASIWEKMAIDGKYNQMITGGGIVHAQIGEKITPNQAKELIKFSIKSGCEHFALNAIYTKCDNSHTVFGNVDVCPICGSKNLTHYTRVVGFFTPVESWVPERRKYDFPNRTFVTIPKEDDEKTEMDMKKALDNAYTETDEKKCIPSEPAVNLKELKKYKYILITLPTCCRCPAIRKDLEKKRVVWKEISASSEDGKRIAKVLGVESTPSLYDTKNDKIYNSIDDIMKIVDSLEDLKLI